VVAVSFSPPLHRPPALTLVGPRGALWLLCCGIVAIGLVWVGELALDLIAPTHRYAYPLLLACFAGAAALAWHQPRRVLFAQRVAVLAVCAHLVASTWLLLQQGPHPGGAYAIATIGPWAIGAQLLLFASWRPAGALALALLAAMLAPAPLLWADAAAPAGWRAEVGSQLLNTGLAQCLAALVLFGMSRQLHRLIALADAPAPLSIDELVQRRHAERQRARQADDAASRSAQALATREAELHTVLETFPGMVAWTNEQGTYQYVNRHFAALNGLTAQQIVGRPLAEIIGPERAADTLRRRRELLDAGGPITFERHLTHRSSGAAVDLLVTHFVLPPDAPGGVQRYCQIAMDITDRKRAESALVAARDVAERASRAKSEFLSRMSHELRTPMNAVLGFGQLLEMDPGLDARHAVHVREILRAGRHLLALIDEVLDLARVEAGRIELSAAPVALAPQVAECLALVRPLAQARSIALVADVAAEALVQADPIRLRQVLINLLSNAIKYNRDGGEVRVDAVPIAGVGWRIGVLDTGPGIGPAQQAQLFEPFNRLGAQHGDVPGVGIGLVITRRLVEAMGGRIGLDSPPGAGCRFWFELPSAVPVDAAAAV
jgi:PAS domain S-box-containing protein